MFLGLWGPTSFHRLCPGQCPQHPSPSSFHMCGPPVLPCYAAGPSSVSHYGSLNGRLTCAAINLFLLAAVMLPSTTFLSKLVMAWSMMALRWHASEYFMLCSVWGRSNCEGESVWLNGAPTNFVTPSSPACYIS